MNECDATIRSYNKKSNCLTKKRVLYVCHNHPSMWLGGTEVYALELHKSINNSNDFESLLVTRRGPSPSTTTRLGTPLSAIDEDDDTQYFFYTDLVDYDLFLMTPRDKEVYLKHFRRLLLSYQPDIVHIQHTLFIGYDLTKLIKATLPNAPIVYTLHEFLPICFHDGQMVKVKNNELCYKASPSSCHECFPHIPAQDFFLRKRFIQSQLAWVDLFITPSLFLLERYVEWGIPREKIRFEENGRFETQRIEAEHTNRPKDRLGFFGQINVYKGVDVLLNAMKIIGRTSSLAKPHLWLHGANLELQSQSFKKRIEFLLEETKDNVTFVGRYEPSQLPELMANIDWVVVPSIWWENSPLVIQEAFQNKRPVICSNIGGMAEKVESGVNGLHFRVNNSFHLSQVISQAVSTDGLWHLLSNKIPQVYKIADHAAKLREIYQELIAAKICGV